MPSLLANLHLMLRIAGVATYPPGATYGPRMLRDYEFVWIIEGDTEYRRGELMLAAPPGSILLCRPGAEDAFRWDPRRRTRHAFIHFQIDAMPADWPPPDHWPLIRQSEEGDILLPLFRHLLGLRDPADALLRELTLAHMLAAYVTGRTATGDVPPEALPDAVERALLYLHQALERDPAAPVTLDALADAASVSPEHLCRLFKSATGLTPARTVRLARLDRAVVLLARSNYSIQQIAALCGFASPFHFSRSFRHAYGHSPRALRRRLEAGQPPPAPRLIRVTRGL